MTSNDSMYVCMYACMLTLHMHGTGMAFLDFLSSKHLDFLITTTLFLPMVALFNFNSLATTVSSIATVMQYVDTLLLLYTLG